MLDTKYSFSLTLTSLYIGDTAVKVLKKVVEVHMTTELKKLIILLQFDGLMSCCYTLVN